MTMELINRFLGFKRIAVVGVSGKQNDFSRMLLREFLKRGYDAVPVNPRLDEVDERRCFPRIQDIQPAAEGALLMTSPRLTDVVVRDCAEAGVPLIWMYRAAGSGAVSDEAVDFCARQNIPCIAGHCPFMFFPKSGFPHSWHGLFAKLTGSYPKTA